MPASGPSMVRPLLYRPLRIVTGIAVLALLATGRVAWADDPQDFRDRVAPILERHCVRCHQGEKAKGELVLTDAAHALAGGESGAAIVPGKPDESLLLDYISGEKPEMPKDAPPLKPDEVRRFAAGSRRGPFGPPG